MGQYDWDGAKVVAFTYITYPKLKIRLSFKDPVTLIPWLLIEHDYLTLGHLMWMMLLILIVAGERGCPRFRCVYFLVVSSLCTSRPNCLRLIVLSFSDASTKGKFSPP